MGYAEGHAEGRAEGQTKGQMQERSRLLKNLIESGMSVEEVARVTKVEIQEVIRLIGSEER